MVEMEYECFNFTHKLIHLYIKNGMKRNGTILNDLEHYIT